PEVLDPILAQARAISGFGDRPVMSLLFANPLASAVVADEAEAMRQAVQHLLSLGHRHFLLLGVDLGSPEKMLALPRWRGAVAALEEAGISPSHRHLLPLARGWLDPLRAPHYLGESQEHGATAVEFGDMLVKRLRQKSEITAILAQNDAAALHVWHVLHQVGWRIPEDYSLVGFDDTDPMLDASGRNLLSSIRMPLVEVGREAGRLLRQRIEGEIQEDRTITLPAQFIPRASVAPPARRTP
ncbi:MAG: substrate-binding domain-containing protein, partial [Planctomycetota bacterium]|nr:substrate-binding domain-containing protein [Planctomycetota bacterium]